MRRPSPSRLRSLFVCSILLILLGVSPWGLWERDEGRYADVAREMLARRDFVTPRINGAVFLDKPPLVYWVTAASLAVWGPGETGARFGQLLFAAGVLLVTRRIGILLFDRARAGIAVLVLASSLGFFTASHVLTLDLGLTFFVSLALFCYLKGLRAGPGGTWPYLGMFAALAGGVLTKGPIALVIPAMTIACFLTLRREWRRARELPWAAGLLLFFAIAAPWYIAAQMANPEFARYFIFHEHLARFGTTVHRHRGAWYYYLTVSAAGLLPWSLLLPLRPFLRPRPPGDPPASLRQEGPALLWSWILPGLVFFSVAQSKLPLYILPLFPAAALLVATMIDRHLRERSFGEIFGRLSMVMLVVATGAALLWHRHGGGVTMERSGIVLLLCLMLAALAAVAFFAGSVAARRDRPFAGLGVAALVWMAGWFSALAFVGRLDYYNETKHFADVLRQEMRAGDLVFGYHSYLRGLPFYLRRTIGLVSPHSDDLRFGREYAHDPDTFQDEPPFLRLLTGDRRVFAVVRKGDLQALQQRIGRTLYILARSEAHELVTNRLAAERERTLLDLLHSTAFDVRSALDRAAQAVPGAAIELVEIERVAGEPTCTLWASRGGSLFEINIPMTQPARLTVARSHPAGEESRAESHLLRVAPPPGSADEIPRLIRGDDRR